MKFSAFATYALTSLFTLTALQAHADYRKGRVRVDAKGNLNATEATGVFRSVRNAIVLQEVTDGLGVTGYRVLVPKGTVHFQVRKVSATECGPIYRASSRSGITLSIRDSGLAPDCRIPSEWIVELRNGKSRLLLEGAPRRFMLTQGTEAEEIF